MGIKIELTDENLPEIGAEYEIRDEEVEKIMKNPRRNTGRWKTKFCGP